MLLADADALALPRIELKLELLTPLVPLFGDSKLPIHLVLSAVVDGVKLLVLRASQIKELKVVPRLLLVPLLLMLPASAQTLTKKQTAEMVTSYTKENKVIWARPKLAQ